MMATTTTLKGFLEKLAPRVYGLDAIYVTDRDGVLLESVAVVDGKAVGPAAQDLMDIEERGEISAHGTHIFSTCTEHTGKMSLGKTKYITAVLGDRTITHVNAAPLTVTFITKLDGNVGFIYALYQEIVDALRPLYSPIEVVAH